MIRLTRLIPGALTFFLSLPMTAQLPGSQSGSAAATFTISGTVYDSLAGRPLAGADIVLGGNAPALATDSLGHFSATGLTPGVYQVGVFHARLDTLDLALATAPFSAAAGTPNIVNLAIPSAATLISKHCGRPARQNEALISGKVESVENQRPIAGADVSLAWTEVTITDGAPSVARKEAHATTDSTGRYTFCGVPKDVRGNVQASQGFLASAVVPVQIDTAMGSLATKNFFVSTEKASNDKRGRITGVVTQLPGDGTPLEGVRVQLSGTDVVAQTEKDGTFSLNNVPLGTQLLTVRKVGFTSQSIPVDVLPGQQPRVAVGLGKFVSYLDPVVVTARVNQALKSVGYEDRKRQGLGQYVTASDIEKHKYAYVTDIIRSRVPGIRLDQSSSGPIMSRQRRSQVRGASCVRYFVDDTQWIPISADDINAINPEEVAGIEFYRGNAAPIRYSTVDDCTTVVIWTKTRVGM